MINNNDEPSKSSTPTTNLSASSYTRPLSTPTDFYTQGRSNSQKQYSFIILLIVNILERFAYYGLLCNYVLFLNKKPLFWESYNASMLSFIFMGITYVVSVIGGWIADSLIGKYGTICLSFVIYIIGYAAYPVISYYESSVPGFCSFNEHLGNLTPIIDNSTHFFPLSSNISISNEPCSWLFILTILAVGFGVGFIKSNIGPFGADQVRFFSYGFNKYGINK